MASSIAFSATKAATGKVSTTPDPFCALTRVLEPFVMEHTYSASVRTWGAADKVICCVPVLSPAIATDSP